MTQYYPDFTEDLEYSGKTGDEAIEAIKKDLEPLKGIIKKEFAPKIEKILICATGRVQPNIKGKEFLLYRNWYDKAAIAFLLGYEVKNQKYKTSIQRPGKRLDGLRSENNLTFLNNELKQLCNEESDNKKNIIEEVLAYINEISRLNSKYFVEKGNELLRVWESYGKKEMSPIKDYLEFSKEKYPEYKMAGIYETYLELLSSEPTENDTKQSVTLQKTKLFNLKRKDNFAKFTSDALEWYMYDTDNKQIPSYESFIRFIKNNDNLASIWEYEINHKFIILEGEKKEIDNFKRNYNGQIKHK